MYLNADPAGPADATGLDRNALVFGGAAESIERFAQPLVRSLPAVRRAESWAKAVQLAFESTIDLVVIVLPAPGAEKVIEAVRAPGSASRRAGLIVISAGPGHDAEAADLGRRANRMLPGNCSARQYEQTALTLLNVAPRIQVHGSTPVTLTIASERPRTLQVENLSASGLLFATLEPLEVGSVFGFTLDLPGQLEPVRGRAEVVRIAEPGLTGGQRIAIRFLALGGEGSLQIRHLVGRELANDNERVPAPRGFDPGDRDATGSGARQPSPVLGALLADEPARWRDELAELQPILDDLLARGLRRRLGTVDWYVMGAEMGLDSLQSVAAILSSIYEGRSTDRVAAREIADLLEVRRRLLDFARPERDVSERVRIMLELRKPIGRLLRRFGLSESSGELELTLSRPPAVVAEMAAEIRRLVTTRRSLGNLHGLLEGLGSLRYAFAKSRLRRNVEQIAQDYGALATAVGVDLDPERLASRGRIRQAGHDLLRVQISLRQRLANIHQKIFRRDPGSAAAERIEADLLGPTLHRVLLDTLSSGSEYLARAHSAYRHAIEATGHDPAILERVARLDAELDEGGPGSDSGESTQSIRRP